MPRLSILMPVYNTAAYLEETVRSVLAQTFQEFELILVDDGSTDGSDQLCDALAAKDGRIRVIHKRNGGVASARNAGLDAALGEYIGWVDSDDLVHPEMFDVMLALIEQHKADIVQCEHTRNPQQMNKQLGEIEILSNIDSLKRIYRSDYTNACALWSKIYRKELFEGLHFTEGAAFEDDEVVPLLLERSRKTVFIEAKFYCYIKRESSIITAPKMENIMALTAHLENRMLRFQKLDEALYELGRDHFFHYLKGKLCDKSFFSTPVQEQTVKQLKKHSKEFCRKAIFYDKVAMMLLHIPGGIRWVAKTEFAPIQNILAKIKKLFGKG